MQILTPRFLDEVGCPLINIHHCSYRRSLGPPLSAGHKNAASNWFGATAHYVTTNLDEGPIIEQDDVRVDHRHSATT